MKIVPQLDRQVRRAFTALCWNVGTPVAYRALLMLKRDDWRALTTIKVVPGTYVCARTLSGDLQIAAFFKKYPDFDLGIDLEALAVESFHDNERQCFLSNERLAPLLHDTLSFGEGLHRFITDVRKEVRRVLGRCPMAAQLNPRFGKGSTFRDVGPNITVPDKMSNQPTLTPASRVFLHAWDQTAWSRYAAAGLTHGKDCHHFGDDENPPGFTVNSVDSCFAPRTEEIVRGNRFTTVPKDAWKLRGICVEPSINLYYQLGVGEWITKRMGVHWDWKKENAQGYHQFLARLGSLTGDLATIDLSNASDTVCSALVKLLLPSDWFQLLDSLRSPNTFISGKWHRLEKFSSMGNGYTFELETLIFSALTRVVCRETTQRGDFYGTTVAVFGDDIICPTDMARKVLDCLTFFGFKANEGKTFISGPFRESCGGDFFEGKDVRPHFLRNSVNEPHQYIALANGLRRFGIRHTLCGGPHVSVVPRLRVLDALPIVIRNIRGPEGLGDLVIHDEQEARWNTRVRSSIRYIRVWRPVAHELVPWTHFRPGVVFACALYGVPDGTPDKPRPPGVRKDLGGVVSRVNDSYISGYRLGRVAYS